MHLGIISGPSRRNDYPNGDVVKWDKESKKMEFFAKDKLPVNQNNPDLIDIYIKKTKEDFK